MNRLSLGVLLCTGVIGVIVIFYLVQPTSSFTRIEQAPLSHSNGSQPEVTHLPETQSGPASVEAKTSQSNPPATTLRESSTGNGHKMAYPGVYSEAVVEVRGKSYRLTPNQIGSFQRINIQPRDKIAIQISYPQSQVGDPIMVEVEDGGTLDQKTKGRVIKLDEQKLAKFNFEATEYEGIYQLVVRNGADVKILNFWAGKEHALRD